MTLLNHNHNRLASIAKWVSHILSPPMLTIVTVLLIASSPSLPRPFYWATIYSAFVIFLPIVYVVFLLKQGKITDIHMPYRHERVKPLLVSVLVSCLVYGWFMVQNAPHPFILLTLANLIQTILYFLIGLRWKISVHTNMAIVVVIVAWSTWGIVTLLLWFTVPLVCWARLYSQRHTVGEVVAGLVIGIVVFGTIFLWGYP